jgi:hypothetical protein
MRVKNPSSSFYNAALLAPFLFIVPAPAQACRFPDAHIASLQAAYKRTPSLFTNIVVVSVRGIYRSNKADWLAYADVIQALKGRRTYGFSFGTAKTSCVVYPLPKEGDRWVVYFWRAPDGSEQEWAAHPLVAAARFDPVYGLQMQKLLSERR